MENLDKSGVLPEIHDIIILRYEMEIYHHTTHVIGR